MAVLAVLAVPRVVRAQLQVAVVLAAPPVRAHLPVLAHSPAPRALLQVRAQPVLAVVAQAHLAHLPVRALRAHSPAVRALLQVLVLLVLRPVRAQLQAVVVRAHLAVLARVEAALLPTRSFSAALAGTSR